MKPARRFGCLALLIAVAGGFAAFRLMAPYQGFQGETFVEFPHGTSTETMATLLANAGPGRGMSGTSRVPIQSLGSANSRATEPGRTA